jgi:tRNA threonylcarbamoyl adenosine modification protein YeaZ
LVTVSAGPTLGGWIDAVLLAIDTSVGTGVAIVDRERGVLSERSSADTRRHAELVGQFIADCLDEAGIAVADLEGVVAGMGPGPFTGLRVGIAAATAFAIGAARPLIRVVSHDAVAFAAGREITVVTDARRKEVYWSSYAALDDVGLPVRVAGPAIAAPLDVPVDRERLDVSVISAASLGMLAELMTVHDRQFAAAGAMYLRSPDAVPSAGPKRVTG